MHPTGIQSDGKTVSMSFSLFNHYSGEPVDSVELHVLAKAYRAAWRAQYMSDPVGVHVIANLGLVIDFGGAVEPESEPPELDSPFGPIRRRDWG